METNNDILKIWKKLRDIAKNINPDDDVVEEEFKNSYFDEKYKYTSKTRKGKYGHVIFLYLRLKKDLNQAEVLLDTGKNHSLVDPENITSNDFTKIWRFSKKGFGDTIPAYILVKPENINSKQYTYEDIEKLILQCYQTLNLKK